MLFPYNNFRGASKALELLPHGFWLISWEEAIAYISSYFADEEI